MKIIVTGAHFTPAVATIEQLKKYPEVSVVYVGRKSTQEGDPSPSAESQVLPKLGIKYISIITGRLQRSFTIYTIPSLLKIPIGLVQSLSIILKEKPDLILSFGGYVALPLVVVGWLFSIPIIIHEQTLVSGLANRISSLFADKIALSFDRISEFDKSKTIITGNPIRQMIKVNQGILGQMGAFFTRAKNKKLPVVLITGGNQGSHIINQTVESCIEKLTKFACVVHITGVNKFKDFERLQKMGDFEGKYLVTKWIGEYYGAILQKADLVVSRAGINTLSEMAFLGKPILVIPIPYLYQDEQNKNAKFFQNQGLAQILPQSQLSGEKLVQDIKKMLANLNKLKDKANSVKKVIIPDAAKRLALEVMLLAEKK